jgi:hypothetical protein
MFESVPKPGRSPSGHQKKRTTAEIRKVAVPIFNEVLKDKPCANTDHGALPVKEFTSSASPKPKIVKPNQRIATRLTERSQRPEPVHGVIGIVLCGFRKLANQDIRKLYQLLYGACFLVLAQY